MEWPMIYYLSTHYKPRHTQHLYGNPQQTAFSCFAEVFYLREQILGFLLNPSHQPYHEPSSVGLSSSIGAKLLAPLEMFFSTLTITMTLNCSDTRDKVYSITALARLILPQEDGLLLETNYNVPAIEVWKAISRFFLARSNRLSFLSMSNGGEGLSDT